MRFSSTLQITFLNAFLHICIHPNEKRIMDPSNPYVRPSVRSFILPNVEGLFPRTRGRAFLISKYPRLPCLQILLILMLRCSGFWFLPSSSFFSFLMRSFCENIRRICLPVPWCALPFVLFGNWAFFCSTDRSEREEEGGGEGRRRGYGDHVFGLFFTKGADFQEVREGRVSSCLLCYFQGVDQAP